MISFSVIGAKTDFVSLVWYHLYTLIRVIFSIKKHDACFVVRLNSINYLRGFLIHVLNHLVGFACNPAAAIYNWVSHLLIR